jgi:hypothetical protein
MMGRYTDAEAVLEQLVDSNAVDLYSHFGSEVGSGVGDVFVVVAARGMCARCAHDPHQFTPALNFGSHLLSRYRCYQIMQMLGTVYFRLGKLTLAMDAFTLVRVPHFTSRRL